MGRDDQAWAVFRCSLLSPLLLGEIPEAECEAYFRGLAAEERLLPNGQRKCVSVRNSHLRSPGVSRCTKERHDKGMAELVEKHFRTDFDDNGLNRQTDPETVMRTTAHAHDTFGGPWEFNEIVGWVRLFSVHYRLTGEPQSLAPNVACLDYSVAIGGHPEKSYQPPTSLP